ncbi:MAG: hypothetical protein ACXVH2_09295 [Methanobacterium sp.]
MSEVPEDEVQITVNVNKELLRLFKKQTGNLYYRKKGLIKKSVRDAMIEYLESEGVKIPDSIRHKY